MVVYVDILVFLNTLVTYFLLLSVCVFFKNRPRTYRLIFGALAGGFSALVIFLPSLPAVVDFIIKLVICMLIVLVTFSYKNKVRFLKYNLMFLGVTYLYAGGMLALWFIFKPTNMVVGNCVVYFNISPFILIISTVVCYLFIKLISYFKNNSKSEKSMYECKVVNNGKSARFTAINDTGNSLKDPFFNTPVAVITKSIVDDLIDEQTKTYLIPLNTVSGEGYIKAFRPSGFWVYKNSKNYLVKDITIAICEDKIHNEFNGLISPLIIQYTEE